MDVFIKSDYPTSITSVMRKLRTNSSNGNVMCGYKVIQYLISKTKRIM